MKNYLIITGLVFVLLALSHILRIFAEGTHLLTEPIFMFTTICSVGLSIWAFKLLKRK